MGVAGLGHIGIQCLKAMTSAQVIAVDTSEDALKLALNCGADHAVIADGHQAQQVRDITGSGADALFDFVGEDPTIGDSVAMLRPGGTYYLVGYGGTVTLPTIQLVLGEITVVGNLIGTNPDLTDLIALAQQGKVVLHSTRYPLQAAHDAIHDLRHGRIRGRAILIPQLAKRSRSAGLYTMGEISWEANARPPVRFSYGPGTDLASYRPPTGARLARPGAVVQRR